jgi:hypothetical protein
MDRARKNLRARQRHRSNRIDCLLHYSPRARPDKDQPICSQCRFEDTRALLLDHTNDDGAEHRRRIGRSSTRVYGWIIRNNFPTGFTTLCANCSQIKEFIRRRKSLRG